MVNMEKVKCEEWNSNLTTKSCQGLLSSWLTRLLLFLRLIAIKTGKEFVAKSWVIKEICLKIIKSFFKLLELIIFVLQEEFYFFNLGSTQQRRVFKPSSYQAIEQKG